MSRAALLWPGQLGWLSDSVLVRLSPLASPPQPLLAPVKFKAGLNFHLVNSFGNTAGSSVSVNISHSRPLGSLETNNHISFVLIEQFEHMLIVYVHISVRDPFKSCNEDFLKAEIFASLARRGGKLSGDVNVFTLSPLWSLDHKRGEDLSWLIIIETWRGARI